MKKKANKEKEHSEIFNKPLSVALLSPEKAQEIISKINLPKIITKKSEKKEEIMIEYDII